MNVVCGNMITLIPVLLIIFLISFDKSNFKRKSSKHFLFTLSVTALQSILDIIITLNDSSATPSYLLTLISRCISFIFAPFVGYNLVVLAIINTAFEKYQNLFKLPLIINAGLSISSLWTGLFFSVTSSNVYSRGPLFIFQIILSMFYFMLFFVLDFSKARRYQLDDKVCFIVNYIVILTALYMKLTHTNMALLWPSVSICLVFYYITHLNQCLRRDTLTDLFNRHMYVRDLNRFNNRHSVTIINIDVNDFKDINDSSGHHYGDEVLQKAAMLFQKHFDSYGFAYRIGGDEFCIILDKTMPVSIAEAFASIEEELIPEKKNIGISKLLSYGYFMYIPKEGKDIFYAVRQADNYMYSYKNRYKARIVNM